MSRDHSSLPDGLGEHPPAWHLEKFIEFTKLKGEVGEPSPHLAMVGYMMAGQPTNQKLWMLGCYAATYCLPSAQVIWRAHPAPANRGVLLPWLRENWAGVVTRTERRCVRTPEKMAECLVSFLDWAERDFERLTRLQGGETKENYDTVWDSVDDIKFFGRYIAIRFIEGLRRFLGVPARLYDIRSVGGWSPKRALCYLYPEHAAALLIDDKEGNALVSKLALELLVTVQASLPKVDEYILAAMLCEYKSAFENCHQYPGWTIDQEPLLYDKVEAKWSKEALDSKALWASRAALFPPEALGEISGWNGTRWDCTKTLRHHGYNWSDKVYDFCATRDSGNWAEPIRWTHG